MTESSEHRVRRALQEVAASTRAADGSPPPLDSARVATLEPRGPRRQRLVLGAVAAAVVVVAAVLAVATGGDGPDDDQVEIADDDTTTTTDEPRSTTTSPTSSTATTAASDVPSTTAPTTAVPTSAAPAPLGGEVLATGHGWEVRLVDGCVVVLDGADEAGRECDRDRDAWLLAAPLVDGRTVHVAGGRRVGFADAYRSSGIYVEDLTLVADSGTGRYVVSDDLPQVLMLREGPGSDWVGGVYDGRLRADAPTFGGFSAYQRATGSLSFGRFQEIGGYYGGGGRCVVARQMTPEPLVVADLCLEGEMSAVLVPTQDPTLYDLFGIAMDVGDWRCELPDGGSCGTNRIAGIAGFAGIIANQGPIAVGDANEVVISTDRVSVVVPVPRG